MIDLERFHRADPGYIRVLVERHGPLVMSIVHRYATDGDEADDLHQEVWIRVIDKRASFSGTGPFAGWLNRLCRNACISWTRSRDSRSAARKRYSVSGVPEQHAWAPLDALAQTEKAEFEERVRRAVARLPERQEQAFLLTRVEGLGYRQTAEVMGIGETAVRAHVCRALKEIRSLLEELRDEVS